MGLLIVRLQSVAVQTNDWFPNNLLPEEMFWKLKQNLRFWYLKSKILSDLIPA